MPNWSDGEYCDCPTGKENGLSSPHRDGEPGCLNGPKPGTHPEYLKGMRKERRGVLLLIQRYKHTAPREALPTLQMLENDIVAGAQGSAFPKIYDKHVDALFSGVPAIDALLADGLPKEDRARKFDAETDDDPPNFYSIAQTTLEDQRDGSISEPGILAHELSMAYEAGQTHALAKYGDAPIGPLFKPGQRVVDLFNDKREVTVLDVRTLRQVEVKYDNGTTGGWNESRFYALADVQPTDPRERKILRDIGMCGHIFDTEPTKQACILPIGHDDDMHERKQPLPLVTPKMIKSDLEKAYEELLQSVQTMIAVFENGGKPSAALGAAVRDAVRKCENLKKPGSK